jgi:hypothetical protein
MGGFRDSRAVLEALLLLAVGWTALSGCSENTETDENSSVLEPLRVVQTTPQDGELWSASGTIRVVFNRAVTEESVREGIAIIGLEVQVSYDPATRTATVTPSEPLVSGRAYTLSVSRVVDVNGNALQEVVTVSFLVA